MSQLLRQAKAGPQIDSRIIEYLILANTLGTGWPAIRARGCRPRAIMGGNYPPARGRFWGSRYHLSISRFLLNL